MFSGWIRISDEILMIRILFIRHYSFSITSDFESNSIQFLKWKTFILFWLCVQITHENNDEAITILYSSVWISLTKSSITSIIQPELALQWAHWIVRNLDTAVTNANRKFIHSFSHGYKYFFFFNFTLHSLFHNADECMKVALTLSCSQFRFSLIAYDNKRNAFNRIHALHALSNQNNVMR